MEIERIAVTPVKGLALHHPDEVFLDVDGVHDNRRFYLVDAGDRLFSAKLCGPLVQVRPTYDALRDHLLLEFPDGGVVEGAIELDRPVVTEFWRGRAVDGRLVLGPFADALSAHVGRRVRLVKAEREGSANDLHPATLVSQASVDELGRRAGIGRDADARRFRMLFTLAGCEPHDEDRWVGRCVQIGEAVVRVPGRVPRCATTTYDPDTGRRDLDTLRVAKAYRGVGDDGKVEFGVYAVVEQPGRVRTGDPVVLA